MENKIPTTTAVKPGKTEGIEIGMVGKQAIHRGEQRKSRVEAKIQVGKSEKPIFFVERHFFTDTQKKEWIKGWTLLREAGLPVPSTMRETEYGTIIMGDVKAGGSEVYGKGLLWDLQGIKPKRQEGDPPPVINEIDRVFIRVFSNQRKEILNAIEAIKQKATEQSVILPYDDPFEVLIKPNGEWKIVILDVDLVWRTKTKEEAAEINDKNVASLISMLDKLYKILVEMDKTS